MFYCKQCAAQNKWPDGFMKSAGTCEVCGKTAVCNDVPSKMLPDHREVLSLRAQLASVTAERDALLKLADAVRTESHETLSLMVDKLERKATI